MGSSQHIRDIEASTGDTLILTLYMLNFLEGT